MANNPKRDIPQLGHVNEYIPADQWDTKFHYDRRKRADYLVTYNLDIGLGNVTLIEASIQSLQRKIEQLRESHDFFRNIESPNTLVIVLDGLSSRDTKAFKLKPYKNLKYLHFIHKKFGNEIRKENEKSHGKDIFVLYRKHFYNLKK